MEKKNQNKWFLHKQKGIKDRWNWCWWNISFKKRTYGTNQSIKYIIGYNDDDVVRPLCIKLPQIIRYVKWFDSNKTTSSKVTDKKLSKNCTKIWENVSNFMDLKCDREPVSGENDKYIKTKIKIYRDKLNANIQGKTVPKENSSYKCVSLIMLDSVIIVSKKYYPQTLLEEC